MKTRSDLQTEIQRIVGSKVKVYFQPPESVKLKYPCVIYTFRNDSVRYADDVRYKEMKGYTLTIIDPDPDSIIPREFETSFKYLSFDRYFQSDNLHHFVYNLYF